MSESLRINSLGFRVGGQREIALASSSAGFSAERLEDCSFMPPREASTPCMPEPVHCGLTPLESEALNP